MKEEENKSDIAKREEEILEFWRENKIFEKSLEDKTNGNFVFYDGPPFATGEPHYGHLLAGTIKDAVPRYKAMMGKKVLRRWGWDCHGLPIENLIEKELGLKSKKDIVDYGVDKFNQKARESVFRYADVWKRVVPRMGRWVDMENDYRTMDKTYTESVWWSFKNLYDKGLIYKSFKSMHLCPRCETTLSNFEVNQGYKDITDISVYVKFKLEDESNTYLLVWTTTPWTLPGNVALAINKDIEYVEVTGEVGGNKYILAKSRVPSVFKQNFKIIRTVPLDEILNKKYKPLFDYYAKDEKLENRENGWKVYAGDFVTDTDGTGIVHIAPAFGEYDYNLLKQYNLPFVQHVETNGKMKPEVTDFAGLFVKPKNEEGDKDNHQKTDIEIIKYLAHNNLLFAKEKIVHSYPHCWRCDTPLLNYATSSWFVKVTDLKDRMLELNKKIKWLPKEIGESRFGNWIEGARDWSISRSRFWGAPLPVWQKMDGGLFVAGSVEDIKQKIKKRNNFFLVRHGESESNLNYLISSNVKDPDPLTEKGIKQVEELTKYLKDKKIDVLIYSPFNRTKQTSDIISKELGFSGDFFSDDRIMELQANSYDKKEWREYMSCFSSKKERFEKHIDNAENWEDVRKRASEFLYDVDKKYEGKNILIVSHGATLTMMEFMAKGLSTKEIGAVYKDKFNNAEVREIDFRQLPKNENFEIDLHKPFIEQVELLDEEGRPMKIIGDVFDTWYDSGSMPFAQQHYPFENKEEFENTESPLFPADFIAEGLDQTRGWFYTLLVLGTALFEKSPYENVLVNGLVLAEDGRKMSKKLKNYPDPMEVVNKYGADAVRYILLSTPLVKAEDYNFSEKAVDEVYKKIISKIENILSFYEMYNFDFDENPKETILDSWIINKVIELREVITDSMEKYELDKATRPIMDFVDDLSNWYIRISRERFKSENDLERKTVLFYTKYVLKEFSKLVAPFMPFLAENIYRRLKNETDKESVHLESWPDYEKVVDKEIIDNMKSAIDITSLALMKRGEIKIRQPLSALKIKMDLKGDFKEIIKSEVNVKEVLFDGSIPDDVWLDTNITEDLVQEGLINEFMRAVQAERKNKKLVPSQLVLIHIKTDKREVFEKYNDRILKRTGAEKIIFENEINEYNSNKEIPLGDSLVSFGIEVI